MIKYLGDLTRRFGYAKVIGGDNEDEHVPAMIIYKENIPGMSFQITLDAIWKYVEPKDNLDPEVIQADAKEFSKMMIRNQKVQILARKGKINLTTIEKARLIEDGLCIAFAMALNRGTRIMLCTGYNLAKCLQMFGIDPLPQAAIQLLLWIQDGLDELREMKPPPADEKIQIGEVTLFDGSTKIGTKPIEVTHDDLVLDDKDLETIQ